MKNKLILSLFLALLLGNLTFASDTTRFVIVSTNDMHAKIDNFPKFAAYVEGLRATGNEVLVFSAGDNFSGNPIVDQYHDRGFPMIDLMNRIGFTASALGNHEFDYGQQVLKKRMKQANFPFVSANVKSCDTLGVHVPPYFITTLSSGVKVGLLGLIQREVSGLPSAHPDNLQNLTFLDGLTHAENYMWLRKHVDVLIVLSHLGFPTDTLLAKRYPEVDLIIGGHTHTLLRNAPVVSGVLITQSGSGIRSFHETEFVLADGKVIDRKTRLVEVDGIKKECPEIVKILDEYNNNDQMNEVIGIAKADITGKDELGSMMTDAVTALPEVDIAFQNNGGIRIGQLTQGDITVKDIFKLDPFGNQIILFQLTPQEIKNLILSSYRRSDELDLQTSGMTYTVLTDADGKAVDVLMFDAKGKPMKGTRKYAVAFNSYIASSYVFEKQDPGRALYKITAEALIDYIKAEKELNYTGVKRISTKVR